MTRGSRSSGRSKRRLAGVPEPVVRTIEVHLRERERRREDLDARARHLRRRAQGTMIQLHGGAASAADLRKLRGETRALVTYLDRGARVDASLARDAFQEASEALLLAAIVAGEPLPAPIEVGVDVESYLLGLGDVVGEVRRLTLDRLAADDLDRAEAYLELMASLYHTLMRFDTTRAIVPLKPKQDTARSLLERTRGEVVMARVGARNRPRGPRRTEAA
ncbi:MAG: translin family protein [Thermoplasmata archaeon]|jgi:translin